MMSQVAQETSSRNQAKAQNLGQWLSRWLVLFYRLHLGWLLGHRVVLITQPVCRSEMLRQTGVLVMHYDGYSGTVRVIGRQDADWCRNLPSSPTVEMTIGREHYQAEPHWLEPIEVAVLLRWSRRHHPITARIQSLLFGWPWPASDQELLQLVPSLGGVAFRPTPIDVEA